MRIVFLDPSGALGGAETALIELVAALRDARPSWTLNLIAAANGPFVDRAARLGIRASSLPYPPALSRLGEWGRRGSLTNTIGLAVSAARAAVPALSYASELRHELTLLDPHIIHTNGLKMHVLGARCAPDRSKLVWHLHDYPDLRPAGAWLLRRHAGRLSAAVANSESVAGRARRMWSAPPVHTVYNAVDLDRFHPDGPSLDLDALAGMPPFERDGIRIGLVATFAKWKGHEVFLQALSRVSGARPVRGYVIGDAIYQTDASQHSIATLREMASRYGLHRTVGFTGHIDDVPAALRALDIVVHASVEPEPFGLVVAEAMACGRPVVVSRAGGAAEIARGGAVFHTPGNAGELAAAITQLVNEPALRRTLSKAGRVAAEEWFSRRRLVDALIPVYESVAGSR